MLQVDVLTLFPEMVNGPLGTSILGRAARSGAWSLGLHDIRDHGIGRHRVVDDSPYGGGAGMVLRVDVVDAAIAKVRRPQSRVILLDAGGAPFTHAVAARLATESHLVLVCGHYEGVDARVREHLVDECISIGDFVLTGGEIAACAVVDAVVRLLPGVLGHAESALDESHACGLLEYPHYTRPPVYRGWPVPAVLSSGDHGAVERWRREQAVARTRRERPDLAVRAGLGDPGDES
jgi:tRNA (guanine37-N1)-methyltransferase